MIKISVTVPVCDHWDLTKQYLEDWIVYESPDRELIIIDNSEGNETVQGIEDYAERLHCLRYRRHDKNIGVGASYNEGLRMSRGKHLFVSNNDVRLLSDVFGRMSMILSMNPKVFVGPQLVADGNSALTQGQQMPYLVGWMIGGTSDAWEDVGYFDESFGLGFYEDVEFCWRAVRKGYRLVQANVDVRHLISRTIQDGRFDWRGMTMVNCKKFRKMTGG